MDIHPSEREPETVKASVIDLGYNSLKMVSYQVAPDGSFRDVHTPGYDFNDEILTLGAAYWISVVRQELG